MPKIETEFRPEIEKTEIKEMLSLTRDESDSELLIVKINFSSLDILQTCMRKAQFLLQRGLQSTTEAPALVFGKAIHKAMEVWYCAPRANRKLGSVKCDDSHAMMLAGSEPVPHGECARCASIFAFLEETRGVLNENLAPRSPENGINILNNYFDVYLDDPFELCMDSQGPLCERDFEFTIYEGTFNIPISGIASPRVRIVFFGRIDSILRNRETGAIIVTDHKTTSSVGKDFLNRLKPNFQYTGYWWATRDFFGLMPSQFMVNGIQVAKTKSELNRQFTSISDEEIEELKSAILWNVGKYLQCLSAEEWPMAGPTACGQWGGCTFKRVCELPRSLQKSVLAAEFQIKGAS